MDIIILLCIIAQVVLGKNLETNVKKARLHFMPTDSDHSLYPNDPNPPQKWTDEILSVLHDDTVDDNFDKTKIDQPTRVNFMKWIEDVMTSTKPAVKTPNNSKEPNNCTEEQALADINDKLSVLNDNIEELKNIVKSNSAYLVMRVPDRPKRQKRSANSTEDNIDVKTDNGTDPERRYMDIDTPNDVKSKLLFYLEDAFNEIDKKIEPLHLLKNTYSDNNDFKVGYIVANIDTLEVNLKKLKDEMENNKHLWDDKKVLDLFDRLKASDSVLSSLLESLKVYVNIKSVY